MNCYYKMILNNFTDQRKSNVMLSDSDFEEEEKSPAKKVPKKLPKTKKLRLDSTQQHHFNHGQLMKHWMVYQ